MLLFSGLVVWNFLAETGPQISANHGSKVVVVPRLVPLPARTAQHPQGLVAQSAVTTSKPACAVAPKAWSSMRDIRHMMRKRYASGEWTIPRKIHNETRAYTPFKMHFKMLLPYSCTCAGCRAGGVNLNNQLLHTATKVVHLLCSAGWGGVGILWTLAIVVQLNLFILVRQVKGILNDSYSTRVMQLR